MNVTRQFSQFLVFKVFGMNELKHRIAEEKRIFTVIEPTRHFVKVGRQPIRGKSRLWW
jgi:hypothetical protein